MRLPLTLSTFATFGIAIVDPFAASAQEMIAYHARCHSLTLFDRQESRRCTDSVATIALADGRTGFAVSLDDNTIVTLTAPASGRQIVGDRTTLAVDQVNFVYRIEAEVMPTEGTCEADDPKVWRASIQGKATTAKRRVTFDAFSLGSEGQRILGMPAAR